MVMADKATRAQQLARVPYSAKEKCRVHFVSRGLGPGSYSISKVASKRGNLSSLRNAMEKVPYSAKGKCRVHFVSRGLGPGSYSIGKVASQRGNLSSLRNATEIC